MPKLDSYSINVKVNFLDRTVWIISHKVTSDMDCIKRKRGMCIGNGLPKPEVYRYSDSSTIGKEVNIFVKKYQSIVSRTILVNGFVKYPHIYPNYHL